MAKLKIGIFDSGIGGLTVAKAIKKQMPKASLVYFGDTAHLVLLSFFLATIVMPL